MQQYVKYLRKSRFDRDYAELSIEETLKRHEAILDKLANDRGYHIAKTYYEVVSGESIAARPEIQKMLDEVSSGIYAGVLVVDLERLARGNGADQAYISQVFQFSGTKIITPMKDYDPGNEFDEEYFEFGLFMSRREYKTITRRLIRGRDSSAAEGKYIGSIAPYGYRRVKLPNEKGYSLEPHPDEAEVIKTIFDMYTHCSGTKVIANYLNDHGVPTRHGDLWTYATVSNIITNPIYMGKIRRGWSRQVKSLENGVVKKRIKRHKNIADYQLYDGLHPALISEDTFHAAQMARQEKKPGVKVRKEFALQNAFAGLIYCGICGKRIARTTTPRGEIRFRCTNGRSCHNVSADYAVVEQQIIEALKVWLEGYKVRIDTVGFADEMENCRVRLEALEQEAAQIELQLENAFDFVEQGLYTKDFFRVRRDKLNSALSSIAQKKLALEETMARLRETDQSSLIPQAEQLLDSYGEMTAAEKNELLKNILCKIGYLKRPDGRIEIDLYPRLPRIREDRPR